MNKNKKLNLFMGILAITSISVNPMVTSWANNKDLFTKNIINKSSSVSEKYKVNWVQRVGDKKEDKFYQTIPTKDKGYVAIGQSSLSETTGFTSGDAIIAKYNSKGEEVWRDILEGDETDRYYSVIELNNGNFVAFGVSYSTNLDFENNNRKGYAIAALYNSDGVRQHVMGYTEGSKTLAYKDAVLLSDGSVLAVCGEIKANVGGGPIEKDAIIVSGLHKIDFSESKKIQKEDFKISNFNKKSNAKKTVVGDMITTSDSHILITGYEYDDGDDTNKTQFVLKIDEKGEEVWSTLDESVALVAGYSIFESNDGFIYVAGETDSFDNASDKDAILLKFDKEKGEPIWSTILTGENYDSFNSVSVDDNGDIIVAGHSNSELDNTSISKDKAEIILAKFDKKQGSMLDIVNLGADTQGIVVYSSFQNEEGDLIIAGKQGFNVDNDACDLINPCTQFDAVLLSVTADLKKSSNTTDTCTATPATLIKNEVVVDLGDKINILDYVKINDDINTEDIEIITDLSKGDEGYFTDKAGTYEVTINIKDKCNKIQTLKLRIIFKDANCSVNPPVINSEDEYTYYIGDDFEAIKLITFTGVDTSNIKNSNSSIVDGTSTLTIEYESGDKIIIVSNVDFKKEGSYFIKYILSNSCGEATKEIKVNVKAKNSNNNTDNNNNNNNTDKPQTGDNIVAYIGLAIVSIAGLVLLNIKKKHNENKDDKIDDIDNSNKTE